MKLVCSISITTTWHPSFCPATNQGAPYPRISCGAWWGRTNFMRFSLKKTAHAALDGVAYRKSGYLARFSRDVGGDRWSPLLNLEGYQSECSGIPHLAKNERDMGHPSPLRHLRFHCDRPSGRNSLLVERSGAGEEKSLCYHDGTPEFRGQLIDTPPMPVPLFSARPIYRFRNRAIAGATDAGSENPGRSRRQTH